MRADESPRSGFALVLGGGGAVAAASSCGALRALTDVTGLRLDDADVIIGTSAGAAMAADLRLGRTVADIIDAFEASDDEGLGVTLAPAWTSKPDLVRRVVGSTWVMAQTASRGVWRVARPLPAVQRAFPASLISIPSEHWLARYPAEWPARPLWLVATDLDTGKRIVLTGPHHGDAPVTLTRAVQASCAVPGLYPPVRVGRHRLIDGGVRSATNLDLAADTTCRAVITLAPTGYDRRHPPGYLKTVGRLHSNTTIDREIATSRRAGLTTFTIRPSADELRHHRVNVISRQGHQDIMEAAYQITADRLTAGTNRNTLDRIMEACQPATT